MIKKIVFPLIAAFLAWQSFKILSNIHRLEIESWVILCFLAWVFNMLITGVFAITGFAHPTQRLLPNSYYQIRKPERLKSIYKLLRVDLFRTFLLATVWKKKKDREKFFNGKRAGISNLVEQSMKSEFGHLLPFIIISAVSIYLISIDLVELGLFTMIWNILGNLYPILLQRYHRMRVQVIKKRYESIK